MYAPLGGYPGYDGLASVSGLVSVKPRAGLLKLTLNVDTVPYADGGAHVHSGYSCDDSSIPGGHFYDEGLVSETSFDGEDPWNVVFYNASDEGVVADQMACTDSGYDTLADNLGRAFVIHDAD